MNSDLKMLSQRQTVDSRDNERQDTREGSDNSNKKPEQFELLRHTEVDNVYSLQSKNSTGETAQGNILKQPALMYTDSENNSNVMNVAR